MIRNLLSWCRKLFTYLQFRNSQADLLYLFHVRHLRFSVAIGWFLLVIFFWTFTFYYISGILSILWLRNWNLLLFLTSIRNLTWIQDQCCASYILKLSAERIRELRAHWGLFFQELFITRFFWNSMLLLQIWMRSSFRFFFVDIQKTGVLNLFHGFWISDI